MKVVFITIPGVAKRDFANALHEKTGGSLDLVVIQESPRKGIWTRCIEFLHRNRLRAPIELWYALLLRVSPRVRTTLAYFNGCSQLDLPGRHVAKTMEVDSVNSDEVYRALKDLSPDLMVVWGSTVLAPRILKTAKKAINLHFGLCPYYRGALANQHAVMEDDFSKIGATIHYMNGKVDGGAIVRRFSADLTLPPGDMLCRMYTKAIDEYLTIAVALSNGEIVAGESQDVSQSKNLLLKDWVPSLRYRLGKKVIALEEKVGASRQVRIQDTI